MNNIGFMSYNDATSAWLDNLDAVRNYGRIVGASPNKPDDKQTMEIIHQSITIDNSRQRVVFARPINPAFAIAEVIWIMAGANKSRFLKFFNPRMKRWEENGVYHGAYGYRLGITTIEQIRQVINPTFDDDGAIHKELYGIPSLASYPEINQPVDAAMALASDNQSRQCVMQIYDPAIDMPGPDGVVMSKDIPCNISSTLLVRDNRLHWMQLMRSNDIIWGMPYNFIQWMTMQEIVAGWIGVKPGSYTHTVNSLHVYKPFWDTCDDILGSIPSWGSYANGLPYNSDDLTMPYVDWLKQMSLILPCALHMLEVPDKVETIVNFIQDEGISNGYRNMLYILYAEALRRHGLHNLCVPVSRMSSDYWHSSYLLWLTSLNNTTKYIKQFNDRDIELLTMVDPTPVPA